VVKGVHNGRELSFGRSMARLMTGKVYQERMLGILSSGVFWKDQMRLPAGVWHT
jgi:hypothetical protein